MSKIKLIYVDVEGNNKVWQAELTLQGLLVQWGRVGAKLHEKFHPGAGVSKFEQLKREKLAKGYTPAQTIEQGETVSVGADLKRLATEQIEVDDIAKQLIAYLTEVNVHSILSKTTLTYRGNGTFTTPLGAITPAAIAEARQLLAQLSSNSYNRANLLNQYLRLIPQKLSSRLDAGLFSTPKELKQQADLLDALASVTSTQVNERVFNCSLTLIPHTTEAGRTAFRQIRQQFESTANSAHLSARYKLKRLYELHIPDLEARFERELGNVQQLWHGTRASNLLSILKNGLIIPPATAAQCTGRMFGNGVYFSNQSTKSLNYATAFWNQSGGQNQRIFMLLADVALGKSYSPQGYQTRFGTLTKAPDGYDSFWAEPGACNVRNHEAIVYWTSQVNLRYLCEFE